MYYVISCRIRGLKTVANILRHVGVLVYGTQKFRNTKYRIQNEADDPLQMPVASLGE